jgi:phosphoserine phosphatase
MKKIVLINISGEDRPGITSMVTGILAAHGINVLDIGQAVIHSHLALGLLVEIPEERETSAALKELLFHAHEAGLQLRYTAVSARAIAVGGPGAGRAIS